MWCSIHCGLAVFWVQLTQTIKSLRRVLWATHSCVQVEFPVLFFVCYISFFVFCSFCQLSFAPVTGKSLAASPSFPLQTRGSHSSNRTPGLDSFLNTLHRCQQPPKEKTKQKLWVLMCSLRYRAFFWRRSQSLQTILKPDFNFCTLHTAWHFPALL